jgi:hypothetical protein
METDALFICIVSCILLLRGLVAYYILIPAFMRYFYVVFINLTGFQETPKERTRFGPVIAATMFLILASSFVLQSEPRFYLLAVGSTLVTGSFVYSFVLQVKYKRAQRLNIEEKK